MKEKILVLMADIIMDKFRICPHYAGDEEPCLKPPEDSDGWLTCNCNGDIRMCDLPDKYFEENRAGNKEV